MPTSVVDSEDSIFHFPLPRLLIAPRFPLPHPTPPCPQIDPAARLRELCEVLYEVHATKIRFHSFPETKNG